MVSILYFSSKIIKIGNTSKTPKKSPKKKWARFSKMDIYKCPKTKTWG
jgi:hypothetical protein